MSPNGPGSISAGKASGTSVFLLHSGAETCFLLCLSVYQRLAACCTKPECLLPRKRQLQCALQKDFNKDCTGALQTLLGKPFHVRESMRGNRKVTDHWVRVAKQIWVSLTQWKVKAEIERIPSKNEKKLMQKGELEKEVNQKRFKSRQSCEQNQRSQQKSSGEP